MGEKFYCSSATDPYFLAVEALLQPLVKEVENGNREAFKKATKLMHGMLIRIHISHFKDPQYTRKVFAAVESYLKHDDPKRIKETARVRKTDKLAMIRTIACDTLEYFAFLPIELEGQCKNFKRYVAHMDNALWLLRRSRPDKHWLKILVYQLRKM